MKVLILSPYPARIADTIERAGDEWSAHAEPGPLPLGFDWYVSYGHRHIVREPEISALRGRLINLHISFLPWGRGSDPNFWAWHDWSPHGVTIHEIDGGVDTGPILVQEQAERDWGDTLASSYWKRRAQLESLFERSWRGLRVGAYPPRPQVGQGTIHRHAEMTALLARLPLGYDTPVLDVEALGAPNFAGE